MSLRLLHVVYMLHDVHVNSSYRSICADRGSPASLLLAVIGLLPLAQGDPRLFF